MPDDFEKINEAFRTGKENAPESAQNAASAPAAQDGAKGKKSGSKPNAKAAPRYTERDYRPVRQGREYHSGCLGGLMYFAFILCLSIVLACVAWMAAADALALNTESYTATVNLPTGIFTTKTVDVLDEDGNVTGSERVSSADIDYVADVLYEQGFVQYKWLFKFFCRISKADTKLDPGEYTLKSTYDYRALVKNMQTGSGAAVTVSVTIPEGFSMHKIFLRLEENGVCSYDELMEAAANATFKYWFLDEESVGDARRLEGFLFPDTYEFYVGMNASSAIDKFLKNFNNRFDEDLQKQLTENGKSLDDILKIASLIEREAANDEERTMISSVIYNRLNSGWTLGLESSVLYLYPDHEGAPTAEMLESESEYNLMTHTGLTPTPICSPGNASIRAALNPAQTYYYFFTLDTATGTHVFFDNQASFDAFVATQNYG